jgi:hypothetical protein
MLQESVQKVEGQHACLSQSRGIAAI